MKISQLLGRRTKENPADAKLISHKLLIRAGFIRPLSNGIYSILPAGLKVLKNIEKIIREEMNAIDGQEVEMPLVQPRELWEESGRFQAINDELARFKDRNDHDMILAMTHEEATVALARTEAVSYKDYPFMIYQFSKKFRDEARPRGGLIRVREFTMKDAYSFHITQKDLEGYYARCALAYSRIFARVGVPEVVTIKSDSGMMGGNVSHEYMLLTEGGEDTIAVCKKCGYKANKEVAVSKVAPLFVDEPLKTLEKIYTPNAKTIEELSTFLKMPPARFAKTVFYKPAEGSQKPVVVMIRGDLEINESKLAKLMRDKPAFADDATIESIDSVAGFASGYGLNTDKCRVIVDQTLVAEHNLITGANEKDYHFSGLNINRDMPNAEIADVATVKDGDFCVRCGEKLDICRGIEVGNIFQLGTKYSDRMNMRYIDENGQPQTPIMGCYGIGIGRLMASIAEVKNDQSGLVWPVSVAPWSVCVIMLSAKNETNPDVEQCAKNLYESCQKLGLETLFDDRKTSAGEKFADADLLGIPLQLIVSPRNFEQGMVEWKERATGNKGFIKVEEGASFAENWYKTQMAKIMQTAQSVKPFPLSEISNQN